jgi:hypothetical protein
MDTCIFIVSGMCREHCKKCVSDFPGRSSLQRRHVADTYLHDPSHPPSTSNVNRTMPT